MNYINDVILPRMPITQGQTSLQRSDSFQSNKSDTTLVTIKELQTKIQMKQGYVQYVSHEIRTPLQVISAGLALLKEDLNDKVQKLMSVKSKTATDQLKSRQSSDTMCSQFDSEVDMSNIVGIATAGIECAEQLIGVDELRENLELVEIMHDSTLTAVSILNDLLLYEKVESDMLVIEQKTVNIFDTVMPIVKMFTIPVTAAEITLTWDLDSLADVYALLDVSKFGQVMRNLISNAIKFTPRGGSVHVSAVKIAEHLPPAEVRSVSDASGISNKGPRRKSLPATASEASSLLSCEVGLVSSKSLKATAPQPTPPSTETPSQATRRPSLQLFSRRSSFANVEDNISASSVSTTVATTADRFSASFQIGEGVDIQEPPAEQPKQEPPKATIYRISVADSGCGISKVLRILMCTVCLCY